MASNAYLIEIASSKRRWIDVRELLGIEKVYLIMVDFLTLWDGPLLINHQAQPSI